MNALAITKPATLATDADFHIVEQPRWMTFHRLAMQSAREAVLYAALCGLELMRVRAGMPRGEWLPWLEEHFPGSARTAQRYVGVGEILECRMRNATHGSHLTTVFNTLLDGGVLPDDRREAALDALHEIAPASTPRQLFLECGVLKHAESPHAAAKKAKKQLAKQAGIDTPIMETWLRMNRAKRLRFVRENIDVLEELIAEAKKLRRKGAI